MPPRNPDPLGPYRAKRALERTPEPPAPAGVSTPAGGGLFVVHKHAARNLHFDLRLEMDGVLRSWAVPKGPSYDTADKRLAVLVEDHPLEYGDFEGMIPEGNYGAGAVIVWDRGRWEPVEDPIAGLEKGKLLFELHGVKLRGRWTLVKIKKSEKEWLLIKERDAYAGLPVRSRRRSRCSPALRSRIWRLAGRSADGIGPSWTGSGPRGARSNLRRHTSCLPSTAEGPSRTQRGCSS